MNRTGDSCAKLLMILAFLCQTQIPAYIAKGCSVSSHACSVQLPLIGSKQNDTRCEMWRVLLPIESKMQLLPLRVQPDTAKLKATHCQIPTYSPLANCGRSVCIA